MMARHLRYSLLAGLLLLLTRQSVHAQAVDLRENWKVGNCYHYRIEEVDDVESGMKKTLVHSISKITSDISLTVFAGEAEGTNRMEQRWLAMRADMRNNGVHLRFDSRDVPKPGQKPTAFQQQWEKQRHGIVTVTCDGDGKEISFGQKDERALPETPGSLGGQEVLHDGSVEKKLFNEQEGPSASHQPDDVWDFTATGAFLSVGQVKATASYHFRGMETVDSHPCTAVDFKATVKKMADMPDTIKYGSLESGSMSGTLWIATDLGVKWKSHYEMNAVTSMPTALGAMHTALKQTRDNQLIDWGPPGTLAATEAEPSATPEAIPVAEISKEAVMEAPPGRYPETGTRVLVSEDIQGWSDAKLRYAINEMYARHGADFTDKEIKKWFLRFSWYHPQRGRTYDEAEAEFSDIEKQNVKLLGDTRKGSSGETMAANEEVSPKNGGAKVRSAEVVPRTSDPAFDVGNIQVTLADGHTELWTKDNQCRFPHVSSKGDVGWCRPHQITGDRYGRDYEILTLKLSNGAKKEFKPNNLFVLKWGFADNDTAVIIADMAHHGSPSFIKYEIKTGRILGEVNGFVEHEKLPKWAQPYDD